MKNLQNKTTKLAIVVIAMLLVSGQWVFGAKWKKPVGEQSYNEKEQYVIIEVAKTEKELKKKSDNYISTIFRIDFANKIWRNGKEYYKTTFKFTAASDKIVFYEASFNNLWQSEKGEKRMEVDTNIEAYYNVDTNNNEFNVLAYIPASYDIDEIKSTIFKFSFNGYEDGLANWLGNFYVGEIYDKQILLPQRLKNMEIAEKEIAELKAKRDSFNMSSYLAKNYEAEKDAFRNLIIFSSKKYEITEQDMHSVVKNGNACFYAIGGFENNKYIRYEIKLLQAYSLANQKASVAVRSISFTDGKNVIEIDHPNYFGETYFTTKGISVLRHSITVFRDDAVKLYNMLKNSENITIRIKALNHYYDQKLGKKQRLNLIDNLKAAAYYTENQGLLEYNEYYDPSIG